MNRYGTKGFSLLEMLLVLAIMATVMVGILSYTTQKSSEMRRDRTVLQMEQFLNAGLSYYVSFGSWPEGLADLQGSFLPSNTILNSWGQPFSVGANITDETNPGSQFSVCTTIVGQQAFAAATTIAGRLPIATTLNGTVSCPIPTTPTTPPPAPPATTEPCTPASTTCTVVSSVNIPGQNLNNARSINFAGLYHNGACVPAPVCPSENMYPTIMAIPVSVSGMNDPTSPQNVYPLSSFTAFVTGAGQDITPGNMPGDCTNNVAAACYQDDNGTVLPTGKYWRACLRIITQRGIVQYSNSNVADAGVILVLTRCVPKNEYTTPSVYGSQFTVFAP